MTTATEYIEQRVIANAETGCWEWQKCLSWHGYAHARFDGRMRYVHRVSYEEYVGSIPEGMFIDHLCRVRRCVNPSHLDVVSTRENLRRSPVAPAATNAAKTHCKHGHEFTPENTYVSPRRPHERHCRTCQGGRRRSRAAARAKTPASAAQLPGSERGGSRGLVSTAAAQTPARFN